MKTCLKIEILSSKLNHLLGGTCAGRREECEEEGGAKCYRLPTIPIPLQRKGEEVRSEQAKLSLGTSSGWDKDGFSLHVFLIFLLLFFQ